MNNECARHTGGYWPPDVQRALLRPLDVRSANAEIARVAGPVVGAMLGLTSAKAPSDEAAIVRRKRILPLLGHMHAVHLAAEENVTGVVVMESDLKPLAQHALTAAQVAELRATLSARRWSVLRLTGYFRRTLDGSGCKAECACADVGTTRRLCSLRAQATAHQRRDDGDPTLRPNLTAPFCDVRNPDFYAVHRRAFHVFAALRRRALSALRRAAAYAEQTNDTAGVRRRLDDPDSFPYIDLWLAARFDALAVVPQLAVQQIKQGDVWTSERFSRACRVRAAAAGGEQATV